MPGSRVRVPPFPPESRTCESSSNTSIPRILCEDPNRAGSDSRTPRGLLTRDPYWIQRIESLERRVDMAEFIATAVGADAVEQLREALGP